MTGSTTKMTLALYENIGLGCHNIINYAEDEYVPAELIRVSEPLDVLFVLLDKEGTNEEAIRKLEIEIIQAEMDCATKVNKCNEKLQELKP